MTLKRPKGGHRVALRPCQPTPEGFYEDSSSIVELRQNFYQQVLARKALQKWGAFLFGKKSGLGLIIRMGTLILIP